MRPQKIMQRKPQVAATASPPQPTLTSRSLCRTGLEGRQQRVPNIPLLQPGIQVSDRCSIPVAFQDVAQEVLQRQRQGRQTSSKFGKSGSCGCRLPLLLRRWSVLLTAQSSSNTGMRHVAQRDHCQTVLAMRRGVMRAPTPPQRHSHLACGPGFHKGHVGRPLQAPHVCSSHAGQQQGVLSPHLRHAPPACVPAAGTDIEGSCAARPRCFGRSETTIALAADLCHTPTPCAPACIHVGST